LQFFNKFDNLRPRKKFVYATRKNWFWNLKKKSNLKFELEFWKNCFWNLNWIFLFFNYEKIGHSTRGKWKKNSKNRFWNLKNGKWKKLKYATKIWKFSFWNENFRLKLEKMAISPEGNANKIEMKKVYISFMPLR
jgi:hypothetical protein